LYGRFNGRWMKEGIVVLFPKPLETSERDSDEMSANVIIYMGKMMVNMNNGVMSKNIFIKIAFMYRNSN
jgi:hypothetical protein